jgi:CheY-like chemotaxis protein
VLPEHHLELTSSRSWDGLGLLSYGAATFVSGEEFASKLIDDTECVISDVQMPRLSGVELQSQLIAQGNRTPIIFVTASGAGAEPLQGFPVVVCNSEQKCTANGSTLLISSTIIRRLPYRKSATEWCHER